MGFLDLFGGKNKTPQEHLTAGNHKQALDGFLKLFKKKPNDPRLMNNIADQYKRLDKIPQALEFYVRMGEHYGERGFFNKSVAAFKKALSIAPDSVEVLTKLAEYNDQVPKYMIDERILAQIRNLKSENGSDAPADAIEAIDLTLDAKALESVEEILMAPDPTEAEALPFPAAPLPEEAAEEVAEVKEEVAEVEPEAVDPEPQAAAIESIDDEPAFVSHSGMDLTSDDLDESEVEIKPTDLWDESIKFEDETMKPRVQGAVPLTTPEPKQHVDVESSIWGKDIFDEEPLTSNALPEAEKEEATPAAEPAFSGKESAVFKISENASKSLNNNDDDEMAFASFEDAIDSIFQPASKEEKAPTREENKRHWPVFRTLPRDVFMDLIVALDERTYATGTTIVKQGEQGHEMFLMTDGKVDVVVEAKGVETPVAKLESGDFFGEASLLTKRPRNATVVATTAIEVLVLGKSQFIDLVKQHPSVLEAIQSVNLARLQQNASRFR